MPRVFISWSGDRSQKIADVLYRWLPVVLQSTRPFLSSEDLRKGGRWAAELSVELEKTNFGILCLTKENLVAPWVLFEAGALSKFMQDSQVAPFLVGVKPSELPSPLTQFNAVFVDLKDFKRLIKAINDSDPSNSVNIETAFKSVEACWPQIEKELKEANDLAEAEARKNLSAEGKKIEAVSIDPILQELLVLSRSQLHILNSPERLLPEEYIRQINANSIRATHPSLEQLEESVEELYVYFRENAEVFPSSTKRTFDRLLKSSDYILRRIRGRSSMRLRRRWSLPLDDGREPDFEGIVGEALVEDDSDRKRIDDFSHIRPHND